MLVVVAVDASALGAATSELQTRGAQQTESRAVGGGRHLVYGAFGGDDVARAVVAQLRSAGWAAAERPTDDDPRIVGWRNRTRPVSIADGRLIVCLPWAELDRAGKTVLEIDPGAAFGAGTHPTTRLLLEALAARLNGGETVLDIGCGSGALALAAVRLGAASAVGIDIDAAAVRATTANAERNGLADRVTASAAPLREVDGTFDVVLANIGKDVLVGLAADIERHVAPKGWLALSGTSPAQVSTLAAAFPNTRVLATPQLDDWCALIGGRRTGDSEGQRGRMGATL